MCISSINHQKVSGRAFCDSESLDSAKKFSRNAVSCDFLTFVTERLATFKTSMQDVALTSNVSGFESAGIRTREGLTVKKTCRWHVFRAEQQNGYCCEATVVELSWASEAQHMFESAEKALAVSLAPLPKIRQCRLSKKRLKHWV